MSPLQMIAYVLIAAHTPSILTPIHLSGTSAPGRPALEAPSIPPIERDVEGCWSEPGKIPGNGLSSEIIGQVGLESEVANDFLFEFPVQITRAWWWGTICEGNASHVTGFNLRIFDDAGCLPGPQLAEFVIGDNANETIVGYGESGIPIFEYSAPISFPAEAGHRYWFVAQAQDHPYPPQWYRLETDVVTGCESTFRSAYFGYPDWIPTSEIVGYPLEAAQRFDCRSYLTIETDPVDSSEEEGRPFEVRATITGPPDFPVDPSTVWIGYRVGSPGVWGRADMEHIGSNIWRGQIPGQEQPAEISYYIHAADTSGHESTDPPEGASDPYRFDVGLRFEPFEVDDAGFMVDPDGVDDATSGVWERVVPSGAIGEPTEDQTSAGTVCWITNAGPVGGAPNDRAKTTLQTPRYDLTGATFAKARYWRWYSNDKGSDPNQEHWRVQVRNRGMYWWAVEDTPLSSNEWTRNGIDLYELYGRDIGAVEMRFIAEVTVSGQGRIVEAAVDDFVLLVDFPSNSAADGPTQPGTFSFAGASPNPAAGATTIRFALAAEGRVVIRIHDVTGRLVRTLADREMGSGAQALLWDGRSDDGRPLAGGLYYIILEDGIVRARRPVVMLGR